LAHDQQVVEGDLDRTDCRLAFLGRIGVLQRSNTCRNTVTYGADAPYVFEWARLSANQIASTWPDSMQW
jgi:hypothetical protein